MELQGAPLVSSRKRVYVTDTEHPHDVIGQVVHIRKRSPRLAFIDLSTHAEGVPGTLSF
jgi:hypothetical protein